MLKFERGLGVSPCRKMHILDVAPGTHWAIELHPDLSEWVRVRTHYCTQVNGRVMCEGEDCRCKGTGAGWARDERVYCPVAYVRPMLCGSSAMLPSDVHHPMYGILCVTEHAIPDLYTYRDGNAKLVYRRGAKKNGPLCMEDLLWHLPNVKFELRYPVVETLERVFGARK